MEALARPDEPVAMWPKSGVGILPMFAQVAGFHLLLAAYGQVSPCYLPHPNRLRPDRDGTPADANVNITGGIFGITTAGGWEHPHDPRHLIRQGNLRET